MNKFVFVVAMLFAGSAYASNHNKACVPLPPKRPVNIGVPAPTFTNDPTVYGAVVKDGQVVVKAPVGSDIQVGVDGKDINLSVDRQGGFNKVLPWNWSIWK